MPAIYLYQAKEEATKIKYKKTNLDILSLMKFIEKNAAKKFVLPKDAHISPTPPKKKP